MTEDDARILESKQKELMDKLSELEALSKKIKELMGLQNASSSLLGPPLQCKESFLDPCKAVKELKTGNLPKVIICGNESSNQIPKIIVCDPIDNTDPNRPVFQQFAGSPLDKAKAKCVDNPPRQRQPETCSPCMGQDGFPLTGE